MPSFDSIEWRPVRAWLSRLLFRIGGRIAPPEETGRHHVIVGFDPEVTLKLVPYARSVNIDCPPVLEVDPRDDLLDPVAKAL